MAFQIKQGKDIPQNPGEPLGDYSYYVIQDGEVGIAAGPYSSEQAAVSRMNALNTPAAAAQSPAAINPLPLPNGPQLDEFRARKEQAATEREAVKAQEAAKAPTSTSSGTKPNTQR